MSQIKSANHKSRALLNVIIGRIIITAIYSVLLLLYLESKIRSLNFRQLNIIVLLLSTVLKLLSQVCFLKHVKHGIVSYIATFQFRKK